MSSIALTQPHYIIETSVKINKKPIKITASKWFLRFSDGSQKLYFVTLYEGRIIQVIDGNYENSLRDNKNAIAITKNGETLYHIDLDNLNRELNRDTFFIIKRYFDQMRLVHSTASELQQFQNEKATQLEKPSLDTPSSGEPVSEQSKNNTIVISFQKRAQALKKRITSPSCTLVMLFGIITTLATAIIGIEVSK